MSTFDANVEIPESPASCASVTAPLVDKINEKIAELKDFEDCIAFTSDVVCTELSTEVADIIHENSP